VPHSDGAGPRSKASAFQYAIVRIVPRVERGESINAGIVLLCRPRRYLDARVVLDAARLACLAPAVDPGVIRPHLEAVERIARADVDAGPIARLGAAERFHWLSAPSSTVIQPSPVHTGLTDDPAAELDRLFRALVG
jgi:Protein of unknown function (DUF3037)